MTTLRLRLSDARDFAVPFDARDADTLRTGIARAWAQVPAQMLGRVLHLHVHTLDPQLGDEWYWVDHRPGPPQMLGGVVLAPGWVTPEEAATLWSAAARTERLVSDHARTLRGLAAWTRDRVLDE